MSEFCVINDAEELLDVLDKKIEEHKADWLIDWRDEYAELILSAENQATILDDEKAEAEKDKEKLGEELDDMIDRVEELKGEISELSAKVPDWRFSDDPFRQWYEENIYDERARKTGRT